MRGDIPLHAEIHDQGAGGSSQSPTKVLKALHTIGWGLYLACSWTWCIGMFLPIVLLHRYGWGGVAVFAIPNVIGCAAFGYVVRTPERSLSMVSRFAPAMAVFAVVTIAFHAYFITMLAHFQYPVAGLWSIVWIPIAVLALGALFTLIPRRLWPVLAAIVWLSSIAVGCTLFPLQSIAEPTRAWQDVIWLTPITTFGFLLCPYLDPTFHRAMQSSPSKHAFAIFGVAFACMIAITCLYHDKLLHGFSLLIGLHLVTQTMFTVGAHCKEGWKHRRWMFVIITALACLIAIAMACISEPIDTYLRFFVFYGMIFPGFVAVFMALKPQWTTKRFVTFCIISILSMPLLESGYIGIRPWMTIPPILAILAFAFFLASRQRLPDSPVA